MLQPLRRPHGNRLRTLYRLHTPDIRSDWQPPVSGHRYPSDGIQRFPVSTGKSSRLWREPRPKPLAATPRTRPGCLARPPCPAHRTGYVLPAPACYPKTHHPKTKRGHTFRCAPACADCGRIRSDPSPPIRRPACPASGTPFRAGAAPPSRRASSRPRRPPAS